MSIPTFCACEHMRMEHDHWPETHPCQRADCKCKWFVRVFPQPDHRP